KPGDKVDIRATSSGGIYIEKPGSLRSYGERLDALAKRRPVRNITTEELMEASRGEPVVARAKKKWRWSTPTSSSTYCPIIQRGAAGLGSTWKHVRHQDGC